MQRQQFYTIINRILSGTATARDREELDTILAADPELQRLYGVLFSDTIEEKDHSEAMQAYAAHFAKMQLAGHFDEGETSDAIEVEPPIKRKSIRMKYSIGLIAALLIIVSAWFLYSPPVENGTSVFNEVVTKKGSQTYVKLPDGTQVWLNSDSKLSYPNEFDAAVREVELTGEAYFEVTGNKARPFIIHAGSTNVKVLGTAFNLRAYPDEQEIETTLIHGVVEVTLDQQPGNIIQMNAGEKLSVRNTAENKVDEDAPEADLPVREKEPVLLLSKTLVFPADSVALETVWRENRLAFDADNFGKMISKLSKWYNVEFVVNDPALYTMNFTAVFENKSIEQVLDALQYTGKFTYRIQDNTVYIN